MLTREEFQRARERLTMGRPLGLNGKVINERSIVVMTMEDFQATRKKKMKEYTRQVQRSRSQCRDIFTEFYFGTSKQGSDQDLAQSRPSPFFNSRRSGSVPATI